jgi:peptide/nickel transport system substrate-binding protein
MIRACRLVQILLGIATALAAGPAGADGVLRVSPHADLKVLDPYATTATITIMHSLMIYDTLYSWDENLQPKPQMVASESVSPDKLTYTFTLRDGLKFHDGTPVTTRDVVASLKRWEQRDVMGLKLAEFTGELKAVDERTFTIVLKKPFPFVETALAVTSGQVPVIMREKEAMTDAFQNVTEAIGSGPFRFVRGEWVPGAKIVYEKNPDYVPRAEPASGHAGGKVVKVDRVEFVILPDPTTKSNALRAGEVDILDQLPHDQVAVLEKSPNVVVGEVTKLGAYGIIRPNQLYPPFNNPKAREALALLVSQPDYMAAAFGDSRFWRECWSFFVCESANGTEAGSEAYRRQNVARAKELLKEAGYNGEKIVMLSTHEIPSIGALSDVTAANLKSAGFNLEVVETDWGTLVSRRSSKTPPEQGGWNIFHTTVGGAGMSSPITNFGTDESCGGKNWFGWPCDEEAERLRSAYIEAPDEVAQGKALEALHARLWQALPMIPVGQYRQPYAWRKNVTGLLRANVIVFWNVSKQ